jgi:hypothetical protein
MNHGPAFQALWRQLNAEVHNLQNKGYFGDGMYKHSLSHTFLTPGVQDIGLLAHD